MDIDDVLLIVTLRWGLGRQLMVPKGGEQADQGVVEQFHFHVGVPPVICLNRQGLSGCR